MAHSPRPRRYPPAHPTAAAADDDDLFADAERLLSSVRSPADRPAQSGRWIEQSGRHARRNVPWWQRTRTWVGISIILAAILVFGGAATTRPKVKEYVQGKAAWASGSSLDTSKRRANGTIVILVNPFSDMYHALLPTLENIETRFNRRLGYPIQLLTDGHLPDEAIMNRTEWITGGKAKWSLVTPEQGWGPPSWISQDEIDQSVQKIGFSAGYRSMCRFFSMWHWKHPAVAPYEYIWRLDEGINFHCSLLEDPLLVMEAKRATYGYSILEWEAEFVIPTLWNTTRDFLADSKAEEKGWLPSDNNLEFVSGDGGETYNHRMYYNNFEIVHRSFFESEPYQAYVDYLDKAGGFFKERWGDAPVRTIAVSLFLPKSATHSFAPVTGYQHDNPPFECPDLPQCDCNPGKSGQNGVGNW
ncbi:hypothetical protein JCM21900_006032 [Sporobolomyces salmonicolor]